MKRVLLYLVLLMAIVMATIVAYVSVTGLLKVFTGAGVLGLALFTVIEISKVVATMAVHTYSKVIGPLYTGLITIFIVIAMLITSMGIYGFLSSSYKDSFAEMESINSKVTLLSERKKNISNRLESTNKEKAEINETISELNKGLANNVIQYKDRETGEIITTTSSTTRKSLEKQLKSVNNRVILVNNRSDSLNNVLFDIEGEIMELKQSNEAAVELGSLKYLSDVTGQSMDSVMKWFILLLIIIGDPMAVIMVIVFSKVINNRKGNSKQNDTNTIKPKEGIGEENITTPDKKKDDINKKQPTKISKKESTKSNKKKYTSKEGTRGYSVNVPKPKVDGEDVEKVGTNKEVRGGKPNRLFFNKLSK